jgi:hypothetical protein
MSIVYKWAPAPRRGDNVACLKCSGLRAPSPAGRRTVAVLLSLFAIILSSISASAQVYFAPDPGPARALAMSSGSGPFLENNLVAAKWLVHDGTLNGASLQVKGKTPRVVNLPHEPFVILLNDGRAIEATHIDGEPVVSPLRADSQSAQLADRLPGQQVSAEFNDAASGLKITWRAILRDGSNYIRQEITISATNGAVSISEVRLIDWNLPDARVVGTVKGSPVVAGDIFTGFEHPLSQCAVGGGRARCLLERTLPLQPGAPVTYSSVIGVAPQGQLRRAFLYYIERERARPYSPFLHYNSWYDLGYFNKYDEAGALDRVNAFGTELNKKRGVRLSSYLFDDGWDDSSTLWKFNAGFPDGFTAVRKAAEQYGADPGVWMSPWGGYGKPRQERVAAGRAAGYEIVDNGFALSGPKYYQLFRDTCFEMIRRYGVNQFKFDGTGNANRVVAGSQFDSDFDAAIHLIGELRAEKPSLYVNLTTGTYPSPFWLRYADSTWRGGEDHSFAGVGPSRERWITYRDADTYEHVVLAGPLYPLNSLMLHGIIYARYAKGLDSDPDHDFRNEVRDYFGTGTQLQEMYVTPSLLTGANWDDLAEAANWSRAHKDVLVDTHWIGGDPAQLEVYGWAAWTPKQATLVLRNPSDKPQSIAIDVARAWELPAGAARAYRAVSPWKEDAKKPAILLRGGEAHQFRLEPFEVLVLDAAPE